MPLLGTFIIVSEVHILNTQSHDILYIQSWDVCL